MKQFLLPGLRCAGPTGLKDSLLEKQEEQQVPYDLVSDKQEDQEGLATEKQENMWEGAGVAL